MVLICPNFLTNSGKDAIERMDVKGRCTSPTPSVVAEEAALVGKEGRDSEAGVEVEAAVFFFFRLRDGYP